MDMDRQCNGSNANAKRAARNVAELGNKLQRHSRGAKRLKDLFQPHAERQRAAIRSDAEIVFFAPCGGIPGAPKPKNNSPPPKVSYSAVASVGTASSKQAELTDLSSISIDTLRRTEEQLWQRTVYDAVTVYKKIPSPKPPELSLLQGHLLKGLAMYHSLVTRLGEAYGLDIDRVSPFAGRNALHTKDQSSKSKLVQINEQSLFDMAKEKVGNAKNEDLAKQKSYVEPEYVHWARKAIHRMLIYMGDICRYLIELRHPTAHHSAIQFYDAAIMWDPSAGMPYNQLGTLAGTTNYGLDAVYNYLRCLSSEKPFNGSEANLKRILGGNEKILKTLREIIKENSKQPSKEGQRGVFHMKYFICEFLSLISDFWALGSIEEIFKSATTLEEMQKQVNNTEKALDDKVRIVFNALRKALTLPSMAGSLSQPTHVTPAMAYQIVLISLMFLNRMDTLTLRLSEINATLGPTLLSSIKSTAVAFMLELMNNLISSTITKIESYDQTTKDDAKVEGGSSGQSNKNSGSSQEKTRSPLEPLDFAPSSSTTGSDKSSNKQNAKMKVTILKSDRQLQNLKSASIEDANEDAEDEDSSDSSHLSNLAETALGTIQALDLEDDFNDRLIIRNANGKTKDKTDTELSGRKTNDQDYFSDTDSYISDKSGYEDAIIAPAPPPSKYAGAKFSNAPATVPANISRLTSAMDEKERMRKKVAWLYSSTYLGSIKVSLDWLRCNMDLIQFCARAFPVLFSQLTQLLNLLVPIQNDFLKMFAASLKFHVKSNNWESPLPVLSVDLASLGFPPLKTIHEKQKECKAILELELNHELEEHESGYFCTVALTQFARMLASEYSFTQAIFYDKTEQKFSTVPPISALPRLPQMDSPPRTAMPVTSLPATTMPGQRASQMFPETAPPQHPDFTSRLMGNPVYMQPIATQSIAAAPVESVHQQPQQFNNSLNKLLYSFPEPGSDAHVSRAANPFSVPHPEEQQQQQPPTSGDMAFLAHQQASAALRQPQAPHHQQPAVVRPPPLFGLENPQINFNSASSLVNSPYHRNYL